jgi:hypothetical protein
MAVIAIPAMRTKRNALNFNMECSSPGWREIGFHAVIPGFCAYLVNLVKVDRITVSDGVVRQC